MKPKVLYFDIETAPNLSYVWGHYEQNVIAHDREWYMLCISYMWEGGKPKVVALTDFPKAYSKNHENDFHVVKALWELLDEADVVIAHNGDRFDVRKANARFVAHGLGPVSPFQSIDTLKVARKYFMFNSNKLDDLGAHLDLGRKVTTGGFSTWAGCMRGDAKSWRKMTKYAKQDTVLLREVYVKLRPWMTNHPNMGMGSEGMVCPTCAGTDLTKRGFKRTSVSVFQSWQCKSCGSYSRSRLSDKEASGPELRP